jgi:hypothetical protein
MGMVGKNNYQIPTQLTPKKEDPAFLHSNQPFVWAVREN